MSGSTACGTRPSVLIVDDSELLLKALVRASEREHDISLQVTTTPEGARAILGHVALDAVMIDLLLGTSITGIDLIREFRATHPMLRIGLLSGAMDLEVARASILAGADLFFEKTADVSEVLVQVRQLLRTRWPALRAQSTLAQMTWDILREVLRECSARHQRDCLRTS